MEVQTKHSVVLTKTTEGQYSPVWLKLAWLVSSLLHGTRAMLVLNLLAFENKKYPANDLFPRKWLVWQNPNQENTRYINEVI